MPQPRWGFPISCVQHCSLSSFHQCQQTTELSTSSVSPERMHSPTPTPVEKISKQSCAHRTQFRLILQCFFAVSHPSVCHHHHHLWQVVTQRELPSSLCLSSRSPPLTPWTHTNSSWSLARVRYVFFSSTSSGASLQLRWFKYLFQTLKCDSPPAWNPG